MELDIAKLVAFALWAESNEGVTGKGPGAIRAAWHNFDHAECGGDLLLILGEGLAFKLINYDTVWEAAEEPEAPTPEKRTAEIIVEAGEGIGKGIVTIPGETPESAEAPKAPVEEPQEPSEAAVIFEGLKPVLDAIKASGPKKQKGKRGK